MMNHRQNKPTMSKLAAFIQKEKLTTQQRLIIHQQRAKQDQFKQMKHELDADLIKLKQQKQLTKSLINAIQNHPSKKAEAEQIQNIAISIAEHRKKFKGLDQKFIQAIEDKSSIEEQIVRLTHEQNTAAFKSTVQKKMATEIDRNLEFYRRLLDQTKKQLQQIEHRIQSKQRTPQIQNYLNRFLNDVQINYSDQLSQHDIQMIKALQFDQVSLSIIDQLQKNEERLNNLKTQILQVKAQYFSIERSIQDRQQLYKQLQSNQNINLRDRQQLQDLTKFNQYLENNMEHQVDQEVNQKVKELNEFNFYHTNRYLKTSDYLLDMFGTILGPDQLEQKKQELSFITKKAQESLQQAS